MITLDYETCDKIAVEVLKSDYIAVRRDLYNLTALIGKQKKDDVADYIKEDYKNDRKLLKALRKVLQYHMTHDTYAKFIEENK